MFFSWWLGARLSMGGGTTPPTPPNTGRDFASGDWNTSDWA